MKLQMTTLPTVHRGALKPLSADIDQAKPEIHERFHDRLMDWVLHRAYLKQDADTFDPNKAAVSLGLFRAVFWRTARRQRAAQTT